MRQLDAGDSTLAVNEFSDARQHFDMLVLPDSEVSRCNASFRAHRRRLDHYQACSADGPAAKMNQMPIVGEAILGGILTHGRHDNPVAKTDAPNGQGTQQVNFRHIPVVISAGSAGAERRRPPRLSHNMSFSFGVTS
jgi:hypothetical protein